MNNNMDPKRPPASRVVHVRGLANGTNESVIKNLLLPYGKIVNVLMLPQNNQALIEFDNVESSKRLIYSTCPPAKPLNIAGVPCYFNFSTSQFIQKNSSNRVDRQPPAQKILLFTIHNAKYSITVDTIKKICEPYGQVIKIVIFHKNELHALVQFLDVFTAQKVKQNLEGCDIYADCCTLKIEYARTDELKVNKNDTQTWDIYRENPGLVPPPPASIPYNVPPSYMPPPLQGTDGIRHQIPGLPHGFPPPLPPGVGILPPFLPPTPVPTPSPSLSNLSNNPPNPYNRYDNQQSLKPETTVITASLDDDLKTIKTHPYYQQYYEQYLTSTGSETAAQAAAKAAALAALKIERSAAAAAAASACASNNSPSPSSHHMREGSLGGMVGSSLQPPHEPPTNFLGSAHHLQQGGLPPPLPPPSHLASHQSYLQTHHAHHQNNRINSNVLGPPPLMQSNQHLNPHHASLRLPSLHPSQSSNYGRHQNNVRGPLRPLLSPYQGSSLLRDNMTANANTSYRNKLQSLRPPLIASSSTINGRSGKLPSVFDRIGGTNAYKNSTESSNALIGGNRNGPRTLLPPISSRPQLTHLKPPSNITKGGSVARLLGDRKSSGGVISIDRLSKLRRETGLRGTTKAAGLLDKTANSDAFSSIVYRACDKVVIIDGIDIWHLNCKKLFNLFSAFGTVNKMKILHDPIDRAILEYKDGQSAQGLFIDDSFNNHMPLLTFFTIDPDSQEIQVSHNIYIHVSPSPLAYDEIYDDYENTQPHIPKNNGDKANIQQMQTQTCQEIDSTVENENDSNNMIGETISVEMVDVIKSDGTTNQTKEEPETNDTSLDENKTSTSSAVVLDIKQTNDQEIIIGSSETLSQPKSNVTDSNYDAINIEVNTAVEVDDEIYADLMGEETLITDDNTSIQQQNLPNTTSNTYSEHTSTVVLQNSQTNDKLQHYNHFNENENNDQLENEVLHHVLPDGSPFNIEDFTTLYSLDDAIILYNLNSVHQEAHEIKNGTESLSMNLLESALAIMDEERGLDLPSHLVRQIHLQKAPLTSTESVKMRKTMGDTKNSETTALKSDNTNLALYTISLHFPTTLILICNLPVDINVNKLTCMFEDILTVPNRILCGNYSGEKTLSLPAKQKNLIENNDKTTDMQENNEELNIEKNDHVDAINDTLLKEKNVDSEQVKASYMVGEWSESEIQFLSTISHTDNVLAYQDKDIVTTRCQNALVEFESLTDAVRAMCLSNFSIIPYIKPGVEEKPYYFLIKMFFCHMKNEFNPIVVHDVNAGEEDSIKSLKRKL